MMISLHHFTSQPNICDIRQCTITTSRFLSTNLLFTLDTMPDGCHWNMVYITNYIYQQTLWRKIVVILFYAVRRSSLAEVYAVPLKRFVPSRVKTKQNMTHPAPLPVWCRVWLGCCSAFACEHFQRNFKQNTTIFIKEDAFENVVY